MSKVFEFEYTTRAKITADHITEALAKLARGECDSVESMTDPRFLDSVTCNDGEDTYALARSWCAETPNVVWYEPGCLCGHTDCIFDPMEEVARLCSCQEDLTPDMQKDCDEFDDGEFDGEGDGYCDRYDDECK